MAATNGARPYDISGYDDKAEQGFAGPQAARPSSRAACPVTAGIGIGNPAPLGLLCFGMTTVMLMFVVTSWVEGAFAATVMMYACFYGGFGQMVAGVLELIKGNTFAGTAFFSYGAFWLSWFLDHLLATQKVIAGAEASKTGETVFLALWGLLTLAFFVPTLRKNACLAVVFGSLATTFFLLAGGEWSPGCKTAAGYVGLACGCSAIYTAIAEVWQESLQVAMPGLRPLHLI